MVASFYIHNEPHNITAELLSQVCHNVSMELSLQPITDEHLIHRTANREGVARLDVATENLSFNDRQCLFFDMKVFNPFTPNYHDTFHGSVLP